MRSASTRFLVPWWVAAALAACTDASFPGPTLEGVQPSVVDSRDDTHLTIKGRLRPAVTLDLDRPSHSPVDRTYTASLEGLTHVDLVEVTWVADGQLTATLPHGAPAGVFALTVLDSLGASATLSGAVEVVASPTLDGGFDAGVTDAGCLVMTWPDSDFDGFGHGPGATLCGPGRVLNALDCNDSDPLTSPNGVEVCNGVDDDCDGLIDEGVCPADAGWTRRTDTGGPSIDWSTAWSGQRGALVIAGKDQVMTRLPRGPFNPTAGGCPQNLVSSWQSSDLRAWVGGGAAGQGVGRSSEVLTGPACATASMWTDPVVGLVGFPSPDGGLELVAALRNGSLARWSPGEPPVVFNGNLPSGARVEDLHGSDSKTLFAVGSAMQEENQRMRTWRWTDAGWVDEHLSTLPGSQSGSLHGLWVLSPSSVLVAGDGLVALRHNGTWSTLGNLTATVRSVRAFSESRVYAATADGQVLRWNGDDWSVIYDSGNHVPWLDLTGTAEDDLWIVGGRGSVAHWPD